MAGSLAGWLAGLPALVAQTMRFTVVFAPGIKKTLVFITFEQLWSGAAKKTLVLLSFFNIGSKMHLFFLCFSYMGSKNKKAMVFIVFLHMG